MLENMPYLGFWTPGPLEWIVILVVVVLIFGRRLPEIARNFGKTLTEFKKGIKEAQGSARDCKAYYGKKERGNPCQEPSGLAEEIRLKIDTAE